MIRKLIFVRTLIYGAIFTALPKRNEQSLLLLSFFFFHKLMPILISCFIKTIEAMEEKNLKLSLFTQTSIKSVEN